MSIRTILAPGVQINEIDKSQYSPAMTGSNCYVMGFSDKGEPYVPMEFTSRSAWTTYYGTPDNEAERYAYAAACEVLNQGGRLYFARLPYDNAAFEKVAVAKYTLTGMKPLSADFDEETGEPRKDTDGKINATPFWEVYKADDTVDKVMAIEPAENPYLMDLSAVDELRTEEARAPLNSFIIADVSFNTYGKIQEDTRKKEKREMIGIMPVVTTAANAMYAQKLIDVANENVIGYETIGDVQTVDVAKDLDLIARFKEFEDYKPNTMLTSDAAVLLNTRDYYKYVATLPYRVLCSFTDLPAGSSVDEVKAKIFEDYIDKPNVVQDSWNGQYVSAELTGGLLSVSFSYIQQFEKEELCSYFIEHKDEEGNSDLGLELFKAQYEPKYGWHNPDGDDATPDTLSRQANEMFPTISYDGEHFDRTHLKKIGIVVYKMFLDPAEGNKISFQMVEAYAGSLCKDDKDPNTGVTTFIDTIVNSQSKYINVFSNCFSSPAKKKEYQQDLDMLVVQPGSSHADQLEAVIEKVKDFPKVIDLVAEALGLDKFSTNMIKDIAENVDTLKEIIDQVAADSETSEDDGRTLRDIKEQLIAICEKVNVYKSVTTPSLGFYEAMTREDISISKSLYDGMNKCFQKAEDVNQFDIDIVPDAGLANIASYLKALYGDKGQYDLQVVDDLGNSMLGLWRCDSNNAAVKTWKTVEQKLDNFCKNVRKDCMFIADGPRPLVLAGQKKIVRSTKPANTIDADIVPNLKYITGLNTSYGACYVDWFEQADDYSGDFFWCPPSIKAMGVYVNTDVNYNYWDAPAGLNRGVIAATDVAFSPTIKQAGMFYEKNFNYAINYPQDGIVLEGQKTLQVKPSAFDRVNVRRLFLRLERAAYKVARYFVYEGNTAYTRQRLIDALDPYFRQAKVGGGVYDYKIKCDEDNNTDFVIDNNELRVSIGIKPVKTAEFLLIDFVALRTGGSWTEAGF